MGFVLKTDDNGNPIQDAIERIHRIDVPTTTTGEKTVNVPLGAYSIVIKTCPVAANMRINGYPDLIPIEEGEGYGNFDNLRELIIKVEAVGASPITILLFS